MKHIKPLTLLLILATNFCFGQDKPVLISEKMFSQLNDQVYLGKLDGWYFHMGHDTAWAKTDINIAGWQKLRPTDLSAKYAGKNGMVECWFRIKLKLAATLKQKGFNIIYSSYAPADIYINGKRVGSKGSTGLFGHRYSENRFDRSSQGILMKVKSGEQITLAMHLVDSLAPLPPKRLKSQVFPFDDLIYLARADTQHLLIANSFRSIKSDMLELSVCLSLSLLFWLLVIQNRSQKVFLYIALWITAVALYLFLTLLQWDVSRPGSLHYLIYDTIRSPLFGCMVAAIPLIVAEVFKRKLQRWIKIALSIIIAYYLVGTLLPSAVGLGYAPVLFPFALSVYYIISSRKTLYGAQWSIVAGLVCAPLFLLLFYVLYLIFPGDIYFDRGVGYYLITGETLSFPLSLLVFVSMRFNEMLREVKQNADEVVRLSEEKKEEALNRQKMLEQEVNRQTAEIKQTLEHLKSTQTQLIQSEKMASLGELTAGIAHEIQNPLNFVNNFSEVSKELLEELKGELNKGDIEEAKIISNDVIENLEKINHHGKRADTIVKGMLEHSRAGSGIKELTDINKIADEYLRLSYHGLRAKDKSFNAEIIAHFDPNLPKINVIPQDIGRVLLNLYNNAFYAVQQKARTEGTGYKPEVSVSTSTASGQVIIEVKDNGIGIPDSIKEKIMQPFFTTKPTGEGTGLGLSLTYDMVVKGHGGSIQVNSAEGAGSEFIIQLPNR